MRLVYLSLCGRGRAACARLDRYRRNDRRVGNCDLLDPGGVCD
jgi:hypothetical protein